MSEKLRFKTCKHCQELLPLGNFYKDSSKKDGVGRWCKDCRRLATTPEYKHNSGIRRENERLAKLELLADGKKRCAHCKQVKDLSKFLYRHSSYCRPCVLERERNRQRARKLSVVDHYGGRCRCCGETNLEFLAVHHAAGDGGGHRKQLSGGWNSIIGWIIKNDFPEGFEIFCHNCHHALHSYGYCPHAKLL